MSSVLDLLPAAIEHWETCDPQLAQMARNFQPEQSDGSTASGFGELVTSICHQQVSLAAGQAIHGRVVAACGGSGGDVAPEGVLAAGEENLRAAGLSRAKVRTMLELADRTVSGDIDFDELLAMDDAAVLASLTRVWGIGDWTAKMFLQFHLNRPDVVAHEDQGLRIAAGLFGVPLDQAAQWLQDVAPTWSPYNSVAARVLWHARGHAETVR